MKVKINVPDSLKEIRLAQYQKFQKINNKENKDTTFISQKMIEIFCNIDLKDVANIKYSSVKNIIGELNKVFEEKTDLVPTFNLNGINFGFIPILDDMTLGEYIDLDTYLGDWENIHKAMNVLYRPIKFKKGGKYNIENYGKDNYSDLLKNMPLDIVLGSIVFFWNLSKELLKITLNYLSQETEKMSTEQKQILQKNGDGLAALRTWHKKMSHALI